MGTMNKLTTVGFSKQQHREFKVWDIKNMKSPITTQQIDTSYGVAMPFYDSDLNILWIIGKGDNYIKAS